MVFGMKNRAIRAECPNGAISMFQDSRNLTPILVHPETLRERIWEPELVKFATWRNAWERFIPFLEFPPELRKVICTTNAIESMNYQLRKVTKSRGHFPSDAAAVKMLWLGACQMDCVSALVN